MFKYEYLMEGMQIILIFEQQISQQQIAAAIYLNIDQKSHP